MNDRTSREAKDGGRRPGAFGYTLERGGGYEGWKRDLYLVAPRDIRDAIERATPTPALSFLTFALLESIDVTPLIVPCPSSIQYEAARVFEGVLDRIGFLTSDGQPPKPELLYGAGGLMLCPGVFYEQDPTGQRVTHFATDAATPDDIPDAGSSDDGDRATEHPGLAGIAWLKKLLRLSQDQAFLVGQVGSSTFYSWQANPTSVLRPRTVAHLMRVVSTLRLFEAASDAGRVYDELRSGSPSLLDQLSEPSLADDALAEIVKRSRSELAPLSWTPDLNVSAMRQQMADLDSEAEQNLDPRPLSHAGPDDSSEDHWL